ncbi:neprilysin-like [Amblyomma americanum]
MRTDDNEEISSEVAGTDIDRRNRTGEAEGSATGASTEHKSSKIKLTTSRAVPASPSFPGSQASPRSMTTTPLSSSSASVPSGARLTAELVNAALNWSYDPCNDFYNFACSTFSGGADALIKAHLLKPLLSRLDLDPSNMTDDPSFDIPDRIAQLSFVYGFPTFVSFSLYRSIPYAGHRLKMQIHREDEEWMKRQHGTYNQSELIQVYIRYLEMYNSSMDCATLAERIVNAEHVVRQFVELLRKMRFRAQYTTVGKLGRLTEGYASEAHWERLITQYTDNVCKSTHTIKLTDDAPALVVLLMNRDHLKPEDTRLLMAWSLLHRLLALSHGQLMISKAVGTQSHRGVVIENFCHDTVTNLMALAVSLRYFRKFVPSTALAYAKQMVSNVKRALFEKLNASDWIDQGVWCLMTGKAKTMRIIIGYPEGLHNHDLIEDYFGTYPDVGENFTTPYLHYRRLLTLRVFSGNVTGNFQAAKANAFYTSGLNIVTFLAGILQPTFFYNDAPAAVNYGAFGQIIGHELMHAYDVDSIIYDSHYRRLYLENTPAMQLYTAKVLCMRASYLKVESASRARTINEVTDSEGFADFTGVRLAYDAYRRLPSVERETVLPDVGLSAEQAFFVAHCLKWCTADKGNHKRRLKGRYWHGRSRCIVPLMHMPEFAEAFSCAAGDFMNPQDRCRFW